MLDTLEPVGTMAWDAGRTLCTSQQIYIRQELLDLLSFVCGGPQPGSSDFLRDVTLTLNPSFWIRWTLIGHVSHLHTDLVYQVTSGVFFLRSSIDKIPLFVT